MARLPRTPFVAVLNHATVLADDAVAAITGALQIQVTRDFAPIWGVNAKVEFFPRGRAIPAGAWHLAAFDHSDQAGALGYHDVTRDHQPLGKVFLADCLADGSAPSTDLSHELLEMLANPRLGRTHMGPAPDGTGRLVPYILEVADAPEADPFAYAIGSVLVSDFVTPAWFEGGPHPPGTRFDFRGHITRPYQILRGGYISFFDAGEWHQITADGKTFKYADRPKPGSRRERLHRGPGTWRPSMEPEFCET